MYLTNAPPSVSKLYAPLYYVNILHGVMYFYCTRHVKSNCTIAIPSEVPGEGLIYTTDKVDSVQKSSYYLLPQNIILNEPLTSYAP